MMNEENATNITCCSSIKVPNSFEIHLKMHWMTFGNRCSASKTNSFKDSSSTFKTEHCSKETLELKETRREADRKITAERVKDRLNPDRSGRGRWLYNRHSSLWCAWGRQDCDVVSQRGPVCVGCGVTCTSVVKNGWQRWAALGSSKKGDTCHVE